MKHYPCSVILLLLFFTSTSVQHGFILNSIHIEPASGRSFENTYENKSNDAYELSTYIPDTRFRNYSVNIKVIFSHQFTL